MYEKVLLWATPVFLLLIAVDCLVAALRERSPYRIGDAIGSISLGALSTYVGVYTRLFSFGIYVALYEAARIATLDDGRVWVWVAALLLYDFLYYWNHRFGHEINVLWAAHVVHHQSEEFNLSTALRQTSSGFLLSWIFYVPMALAGFPPRLFLFVSLIDLLYQFWIHTEQIGSLGMLDRILATPSNHRVHHGVNDEYVDKNYGGILILWDRLFGTFQPELATVPVVFGSRDPLRSWNPLWANLHTYAALFRDASRAGASNDRLRVFFARPGWRPADVAARDPKPAFVLERCVKFAPSLPGSLAAYCVLQGFGVLALGAYFMAVAPAWPTGRALMCLALLVGSQWILGGLTEARRGFAWLEATRLLAIAAVALIALSMAGAREWKPQAALAFMLGAGSLTWLWVAMRAPRPVAAA